MVVVGAVRKSRNDLTLGWVVLPVPVYSKGEGKWERDERFFLSSHLSFCGIANPRCAALRMGELLLQAWNCILRTIISTRFRFFLLSDSHPFARSPPDKAISVLWGG